VTQALLERMRDVIALHIDPQRGSAYWRQRCRGCGLQSADELRTWEDLDRLGTMSAADLRERPLLDYIPRQFHEQRDQLIVGQTGGSTGDPVWTAYLPQEFHDAFVAPFAAAAAHVAFPRRGSWLYVGPSGPHIIGQAARAIARSTASAEPFSVDFDPRWSRKLPSGSMAAGRYLQHVLGQAMRVIQTQPVDVLFATPPVLLGLAEQMTEPQRARIAGVHYGGMPVTPELLDELQNKAFTQAVHLSGYGNTLLGCCLEPGGDANRCMDYFPHGNRLRLEVVNGAGHPDTRGRVCATRLDHSFLIIRLLERDHAQAIDPPADGPDGWITPGVRNPATPQPTSATPAVATLY